MTTKNHRPTSEHSQADQCPSCGSYCDIFQDLDEQDYCNDCRAETPESRRTETLEKFNNGEQRYEDDQNFKEAVDSLAAKIGVYAVLDKTLNQLRVLREIHANNTNLLAIEGGRSRRLAGEADNLRAYTAEVEKANADWVEAHDKLKEEANNLRASNRSLIESNMALTERLRDYESR